MRKELIFAILSFGLLMAALFGLSGGASAQQATEAPAPASTQDFLLATVEPTAPATEAPALASRDLGSVQLDSTHSVSQIIPYEGGTMTTTGSDGTKYTLTFDKGSVLVDYQITMTPFTSVTTKDGKSYPTYGVKLGPDGLGLFEPATLLIEPAQAIPVAQQFSYSFEGAGQGTYRYPLDVDPKKIEFHIFNFSGFGVSGPGSGGQDGLGGITDNDLGSSTSWQSTQEQITALANDVRNGSMSEDAAFAEMQTLLVNYEQAVIQPEINALANNPNPTEDDVAAVAQQLFSLDRDYTIVGGDGDLYTGAFSAQTQVIIKAVTKVLSAAQKACSQGDHNDLTYEQNLDMWLVNAAGVKRVLQDARDLLLLTEGKSSDDPKTLLKNCQPAGFQVSDLTLDQTGTTSEGSVEFTMVIDAHTCGVDPFTKPWTAKAKGTTHVKTHGQDFYQDRDVDTQPITLPKFEPYTIPQIGLTLQILPNPPAMQASAHIPNFDPSGTVTAAMVEDKADCGK